MKNFKKRISLEENNEINIEYNIKKNNYRIKLFGYNFVKNNKNICKIMIEDKEYELKEYFFIENIEKDKLEIKLKNINNITNMSYMFSDCSQLSLLTFISKWDINNVTNISYMFDNCLSLSILPDDISNWNTNNVTDMSYMFSNCSKLTTLPDISNWNINNVTDMSYMFDNCLSLLSLPDISKWNTNNVTNMSNMFYNCKPSLIIPKKFKYYN